MDTDALAVLHENLRGYVEELNNSGTRSRERSLVITKLEEAMLWLDRAITLEREEETSGE